VNAPEGRYALVIFDCDGVLEGITVDRDYVFRHCIGHSFSEAAEKIRCSSGKVLPDGFEARYRASLMNEFEASLKPTAGVIDILSGLGTPFCIATSSGKERAQRSLLAAGLTRFNAPLFTVSMVARGKPAPDLFLLAAEQMRTPPEKCLVIEDSLPGILAARAAGMAVWRFSGASHFRLGFGKDDPQLADGHLSSWDGFFARFPHLYRDR
jgi:HAD superfamily hydrolase (TIGR01509 family)